MGPGSGRSEIRLEREGSNTTVHGKPDFRTDDTDYHYGVYKTDTSFWTKRTLRLCVVGVKLKQVVAGQHLNPGLATGWVCLTSALSLSITYIHRSTIFGTLRQYRTPSPDRN